MNLKARIRDIIFTVPFLKKHFIKKRMSVRNDHYLLGSSEMENYLEEAEKVLIDSPLYKDLSVGLVKDGDNYEGYVSARAYFPKYERFLKNNHISYEYYDIYANDWQIKAKLYDVVIWHTDGDPATQSMAKNKIYVLDKLMGIKCMPCFDEIWGYEDKVNAHYFYQHYNLPEIPTFVTHLKADAIVYAESANYPLISKLDTGAGSVGVDKIENKKQAIKLINKAFSYKGAKTFFHFHRQKNYVLFQEFIDDATYDLRIMVIGDKLFGYYRHPKKGDFKASGAGNVIKKEIDSKALEIAYNVKNLYGANFLATDLLFSEKLNTYYIIESSIFIGVDTCEQLKINNVPGYYKRINKGEYVFVEGKYWVQELTLQSFFNELLES